mmetsp:Transcript_22180/g.61330  ORF Transcript_22180/g.61330 Transcript_22180/m.61330 type:complete len:199 (+) Transcript_22180:50-646(+)|eukprot:CAMPEP_0202352420 /NCGR_PEP_ID=MMETSP1126-20121109/8627_1 /ASSEMBLY_ACC=CAM_ASM_000457 /TAXON_ID=3047 /ORGANISM="Dunaliella tertiolecta, Strain CCMP1320" /LENGTH=198 /DNA_ID=CAMNT_0048944643 /DNA_START=44 /DNA_END=640 /DNA_ORIENTATION=+
MSLLMKLSTSSASSKAVGCRAVPAREAPASARRALLLSGSSLFVLSNAPKAAQALIPDEEDEELLKRAKENRAKTLAEQQQKTRSFMQSEGLANGKLNSDLVPVQKAVNKLAESGKLLEAGDAKQASRILTEPWVKNLKSATRKFSGPSDEVMTKLYALQDATKKDDLMESRTTFVSLVEALEVWASSAGVQSYLKGL